MKINELTGAQLDYWVAKADELEAELTDGVCFIPKTAVIFRPSTDWAQGGQIIDRERIAILPTLPAGWVAELKGPERHAYCNDDSPLVAAMRAYVGYTFGAEVPDQAGE